MSCLCLLTFKGSDRTWENSQKPAESALETNILDLLSEKEGILVFLSMCSGCYSWCNIIWAHLDKSAVPKDGISAHFLVLGLQNSFAQKTEKEQYGTEKWKDATKLIDGLSFLAPPFLSRTLPLKT